MSKCERAGCTASPAPYVMGLAFEIFDLGPTGTRLCAKCAKEARQVGFQVKRSK